MERNEETIEEENREVYQMKTTEEIESLNMATDASKSHLTIADGALKNERGAIAWTIMDKRTGNAMSRGSKRAQVGVGTTAAHVARAALESFAFQSAELVQAMRQDARIDLKVLKVDGGACANDVLMQFQADLLDCQIQRPKMIESTAWGAASLAGLAAGIWPSFDELRKLWLEDQSFLPRMNEEE